MNKLIITAAASLLVSATALTSAAEAGGGVRLGFGFPLGGFTARPTSQPYHGAGNSHRMVESHNSWKKQKAIAAHRKSIDDDEDEAPRRSAKSKKSSEVAHSSKKKDEETVASNDPGAGNGTVTAALTAADVQANAAPAATANQPVKEIATVEPPPAKVVAPVVAKVVEPVATAPAPQPKSAKKGFDCRKFIPSVGVTISVKCSE